MYIGNCGYTDNESSMQYDSTFAVLKWNDSAFATPYIRPIVNDFVNSMLDSTKLGLRFFDYEISLGSTKYYDNAIIISETFKYRRNYNKCRGVIPFVRAKDSSRDSLLVFVNFDADTQNVIRDCFKETGDSIDLYLYAVKRPEPYYKPDGTKIYYVSLDYDGTYNQFAGALYGNQLIPFIFTRKGKRIISIDNLNDTVIDHEDYRPIFDSIGVKN